MPRPKTTHTDTKSVQRQVSCFVWHRLDPPTWWRVVVVSLRLLKVVRPLFPPPSSARLLLLPSRVFSNSLSSLPMSFWLVPRYLARCFAPFSLSYFMAQTFPTFCFVLFLFSQPSCALLFSPAKHQRCLSISHPPGLTRETGLEYLTSVCVYIYIKVSSFFSFFLQCKRASDFVLFSNSSSFFHSHHHHSTYFFVFIPFGPSLQRHIVQSTGDYFRSDPSQEINLGKKKGNQKSKTHKNQPLRLNR